MTSEEDVSVAGSPLLTRKRFGSFSGDNPGREDCNYSPGQLFVKLCIIILLIITKTEFKVYKSSLL